VRVEEPRRRAGAAIGLTQQVDQKSCVEVDQKRTGFAR
jgi:hypothetical protein